MLEQNSFNLYEQELKKQKEILDSLNKNLTELNVEKDKISPQEYKNLYSKDEQKIRQYIDKTNSEITRLEKIIDAYYNITEANERLERLEKIIPRDGQDKEELESERKYIEELKNKNLKLLPEDVKKIFIPSHSDLEEEISQQEINDSIEKGIDDYRKEIEQSENEIKRLKENIEELISLKNKIPESEYERDLAMLKRYKNRERGKLLRNRQIVTAYELLENNQERIVYLNSLVARDEQDEREIQEELDFLTNENEENKRFIPKNIRQNLIDANEKKLSEENIANTTLQPKIEEKELREEQDNVFDDNSYIQNFSMINPKSEEIISEETKEEKNNQTEETSVKSVYKALIQPSYNQVNEPLDFSKSQKAFEEIIEKAKKIPIGIPEKPIQNNSFSSEEQNSLEIEKNVDDFEKDYPTTTPNFSIVNPEFLGSKKIIDKYLETGNNPKHDENNDSNKKTSSEKNALLPKTQEKYSKTQEDNRQLTESIVENSEEKDKDCSNDDANKKKDDGTNNLEKNFKDKISNFFRRTYEVINIKKSSKNIRKKLLFGIGTIATILGAIATGHLIKKHSNETNDQNETKIEGSMDSNIFSTEGYDSDVNENEENYLESTEEYRVTDQVLDSNGDVIMDIYENPSIENQGQADINEETIVEDINEESIMEDINEESNMEEINEENLNQQEYNEQSYSTESASIVMPSEEIEYQDESLLQSGDNLVTMESVKENNLVNTNDIRLGNTIKINPNASIHSNTFDAYLNENPKTQYFKNNPDRVVIGVSILNENGLERIYAYTPDANNKINQLINEGGDIVSILTANKEKYLQDYDGSEPLIDAEVNAYAEGWYNVNSVQTQNTKGLQR